jgi:hypothetical protein
MYSLEHLEMKGPIEFLLTKDIILLLEQFVYKETSNDAESSIERLCNSERITSPSADKNSHLVL